jgi:hypothetical protein
MSGGYGMMRQTEEEGGGSAGRAGDSAQRGQCQNRGRQEGKVEIWGEGQSKDDFVSTGLYGALLSLPE